MLDKNAIAAASKVLHDHWRGGTKLTGLDAATRLGPVVTVILPSGALIDLR